MVGATSGPIIDNLAKEYLRENTLIDRMPVIRNHEDNLGDRKRAKEGKLQMRGPLYGFCWCQGTSTRSTLGF